MEKIQTGRGSSPLFYSIEIHTTFEFATAPAQINVSPVPPTGSMQPTALHLPPMRIFKYTNPALSVVCVDKRRSYGGVRQDGGYVCEGGEDEESELARG